MIRRERSSDSQLNIESEDKELYYNSMCFVSPDGVLLATYDKSFLYETDHKYVMRERSESSRE